MTTGGHNERASHAHTLTYSLTLALEVHHCSKLLQSCRKAMCALPTTPHMHWKLQSTHTHTHTHTHIPKHKDTHTYTCSHAHMHNPPCKHMHTHTHTHTFQHHTSHVTHTCRQERYHVR